MSSPAPARLPSDLELRPLMPADAVAIVALIGACDRTYLEWAPSGWSPPPEEPGIAKWGTRLGEAKRWAEGAFERSGDLVAMASARAARGGRWHRDQAPRTPGGAVRASGALG